jgi:very-short-patch-repair endonuclease
VSSYRLPLVTTGAAAGVLRIADASRRYGRARVRWAIRDGRWQVVHDRVVVLHNGPITPDQSAWAAVLAGPPGSVLGGPTAARLGGLKGSDDDVVHLVVPHRSHVAALEGVTVVRSSLLGAEWVHPVQRPPRLRIERCGLDLASAAPSTEQLVAVVAALVQQRLTIVPKLRHCLSRMQRLPRRAVIAAVLEDVAGGAHSLPEVTVRRLIRRAGLPDPRCQVRRRRRGGHYYLDLCWLELGVAVEIDGIGHLDAWAWTRDLRRGNELTRGGLLLLRFASYQVRLEPDYVVDTIRGTLIRAGWDGRG